MALAWKVKAKAPLSILMRAVRVSSVTRRTGASFALAQRPNRGSRRTSEYARHSTERRLIVDNSAFRSEWLDEYTRQFQGSQDAGAEGEYSDEEALGPGAVAELSLDEKLNIFNEMMHGVAGDSEDELPRDGLNGQKRAARKPMSAKARGKARAGQSEAEEEGSDDAFRPTTSKRTIRGPNASRKAGAEASNGRAERGKMVRIEGGRLIR